MGQSVRPFLDLLLLLLLQSAALDQGVGQIVFRLSPQPLILAPKHLAERFQGLVVIALLVRCRAPVELQAVGSGVTIQLILKNVVRALVVFLVVQIQTLILRPTVNGGQ